MTEQENIREKIIKEFQFHLLRTGENPITVFAFCENIGIDETQFFNEFNSFKALEKEIWLSYFNTIKTTLEIDEEFESFSTQEKVLSFHYALLELYLQNRSYVILRFSSLNYQDIKPWFLDSFKNAFNDWTHELLESAYNNNEIVSRPIVSYKYSHALWIQFLYITKVWVNDESKDFQITDAAIEKTCALIFELMKKGPVDLLIDFIKFAYQNKAY